MSFKIEAGGEGFSDESLYIRTEDVVCLFSAQPHDDSSLGYSSDGRGYLAAEGIGSRLCYLQPQPGPEDPHELWNCAFEVGGALSVHAMYTQGYDHVERQGISARKVILYGHAILLRHVGTRKMLRCTSSSPADDRLAYHIGFADDDEASLDESCWFTIHPVSKQRSEGEKVQAGDEVFLVSVANERYLSMQLPTQTAFDSAEVPGRGTSVLVVASFAQCVWSVQVVCVGGDKEAGIGHVNGGDVVRVVCGGSGADEFLSVSSHKRNAPGVVCFESGRVEHELRSLWRVELTYMRFGWAFVDWGQAFRLRHVMTGKFLAIESSSAAGGRYSLVLQDAGCSSLHSSAFCFTSVSCPSPMAIARWAKGGGGGGGEGMGVPRISYGDSAVHLYHVDLGRYVALPTSDRCRRLGGQCYRMAAVVQQVNRNYSLSLARASLQHATAASMGHLCTAVLDQYLQRMLAAQPLPTSLVSSLLSVIPDVCSYLSPRACSCDKWDSRQQLMERQTLFEKQEILLFTMHVMETSFKRVSASPDLALEQIQHCLYSLLVAMLSGNHDNCKVFAALKWLDVLIEQLGNRTFKNDVLEVLQCLLDSSPEVLNLLSGRHISAVVRQLCRNGRDDKVMKLLSSVCVCCGVAMREKQELVCDHLLQSRQLLLHTTLHSHLQCMHASVCVGLCDGGSLYKRWYYEVCVTGLPAKGSAAHLRVGWAQLHLFRPSPISNGFRTTDGGVGDDVYSIGCDGARCWFAGMPLDQRGSPSPCTDPKAPPLLGMAVGDVIGCCLDTSRQEVWFTRNGWRVLEGQMCLRVPHMRESITPAFSASCGVCVEVSMGRFKHPPAEAYAGLCEAVLPGKDVKLKPFVDSEGSKEGFLLGPSTLQDHLSFIPAPIDTSDLDLPDCVYELREEISRNLHEVWSKNKIEAGYTFGKVRNDALKQNSCLVPFNELDESDKAYDYTLSMRTLETLVALGYKISQNKSTSLTLMYQELPPEQYRLSNGYLPRPFDLSAVSVDPSLMGLVSKLAENAHNVYAAQKIKEGWTYGLCKDDKSMRNPCLLPYKCLDEATKKSNWDTAHETVRTLCALGCTLQPPLVTPLPSSLYRMGRELSSSQAVMTTYRAEYSHGLKAGMWYYEVEVLTEGLVLVGWATPSFPPWLQLGEDLHSYAFDGYRACKRHNGSVSFGQRWMPGDTLGCYLDLQHHTMSFSLNGQLLEDSLGSTLAFERVGVGEREGEGEEMLVPAITLAAEQRVKVNFEASMISDYRPVAHCLNISAAQKSFPLWLSSAYPSLTRLSPSHPRLQTTIIEQGSSMTSIGVWHRDPSMHSAERECLRLDVGVALKGPSSSPAHPISYSIAVPVGQDPAHFLLGWTTPEFVFQRQGGGEREGQWMEVGEGGGGGAWEGRYSTCYLVGLGDLLSSDHEGLSSGEASITCVLHPNTGKMTFSTANCCKSELVARGNCKLFPTVLTTPSQQHLVTIDLPLGQEGMWEGVGVMVVEESVWMRQVPVVGGATPTGPVGSHDCAKLGYAGPSEQQAQGSSTLTVTLLREDLAFNMLELSEQADLLHFHLRTLEAFRAVCSHGNLKCAEKVGCLWGVEELMCCVGMGGLEEGLGAGYLSLVSSLHLQHEVDALLLTRGEHILPLSACASPPLLSPFHPHSPTPLHHLTLGSIGQCFSSCAAAGGVACSFPLGRLKEVVLVRLEAFLSSGDRLCSQQLVPLLGILDSLLVIGVLKSTEDIRRLLCILDPLAFYPGEGHSCQCGFLSPDTLLEEPVKQVLCVLLHHLCDQHVRHRVECVVGFAWGYTQQLQADQQRRHSTSGDRLTKEFRSSPEHQVEKMLAFKSKHLSKCPTAQHLKSLLVEFHDTLSKHCGLPACGGMASDQPLDRLSLREKLGWICKLTLEGGGGERKRWGAEEGGLNASSLQLLIVRTMLQWASQDISNTELARQVFSLLYRQYNELQEVAQALSKTYVIDDTADKMSLSCIAVVEFQRCLGMLRALLRVGLGLREEELLRKSLRAIRNSDLFYCHPHLMRALGLHSTVLELLLSYLGTALSPSPSSSFSTTSTSSQAHNRQKVIVMRRKMKLTSSLQDLPYQIVKSCCKFLCAFARISVENQWVLFSHLDLLLQHAEKHPDLASCSEYSLLDIAISTIRGNQELALSLEETHFEHVVALLVAMTTGIPKKTTSLVISMSASEWAPNGGEKCLEWLYNAVWVEDTRVLENAYIVVRLLVRNSECLGPVLLAGKGYLLQVYQDLSDASSSASNSQMSPSAEDQPSSHPPHPLMSHSSSLANISSCFFSSQTAVFYTSLLRLLGRCCPSPSPHHPPSQTPSKHTNSTDRMRGILQNLLSESDLLDVLRLPLARGRQVALHPVHKEAVLMYLESVYGVSASSLLTLLTSAFLADMKTTLHLSQGDDPVICCALNRYICCSVLPLLSRHAHLFPSLLSHIHLLNDTLLCSYRLVHAQHISSAHLEQVCDFMSTVIRQLPPGTLTRLVPKIERDISNLSTRSCVALRLLASHYEHFSVYYGISEDSGNGLRRSAGYFGFATQEEKLQASRLFYLLLSQLNEKIPEDTQLLKECVSCLKAVTCALPPDTRLPSTCDHSITLQSHAPLSYQPCPLDVSNVKLWPEISGFVSKYASYLHDSWVFDQHSMGWIYGTEFCEKRKHDPKLRPFNELESTGLVERLAEHAHNTWALELLESSDPLSASRHPCFLPYELLDEVLKSEYREAVLELLRFLKVMGFEPVKSRTIPSPSSRACRPSSASRHSFGLQLLTHLQEQLSGSGALRPLLYQQVHFPVWTAYLSRHRGFFLPAPGQGYNLSSQNEKLAVPRLLCQVNQYLLRNMEEVFPATASQAQNLSSAQTVCALLHSLIQSLDVIGIAGSDGLISTKSQELVTFFNEAASSLLSALDCVKCTNASDHSFKCYLFTVLIPSLTAFFTHIAKPSWGRCVIEGPILHTCGHIFANLCELAKVSGPVFVGSAPLTTIGQCLGACALAYPDPFLDKSLFSINLDYLFNQLSIATASGVTCGNVLFVADVIIPVLASYLTKWGTTSSCVEMVQQIDGVLTHVLCLMLHHFGQREVLWMHRVMNNSCLLAGKCSLRLLDTHFLPVTKDLYHRAVYLWQEEQLVAKEPLGDQEETSVSTLVSDYRIFARDLTSVLPFLCVLLWTHREHLKTRAKKKACKTSAALFNYLVDIFHYWTSSKYLTRELALMVVEPHVINSLCCLHTSNANERGRGHRPPPGSGCGLLLLCVELLVPVREEEMEGMEREMVGEARDRLVKGKITEAELRKELEKKLIDHAKSRQSSRSLVRQISSSLLRLGGEDKSNARSLGVAEQASMILQFAKLKWRLEKLESAPKPTSRWKQLISQRRRKAVVNCFLAIPYFQLRRARAINLFLQNYCSVWLNDTEQASHHQLLATHLLCWQDYLSLLQKRVGRNHPRPRRHVSFSVGDGRGSCDPLTQLFSMFRKLAHQGMDVSLYQNYVDVLSKGVLGSFDEDFVAENSTSRAYEVYYQQKAELLHRQEQLGRRGAAETVIAILTASGGVKCPSVLSSLRLGIALLQEGNLQIQQEMLQILRNMDVEFLSCLAKLISSCSVLDWDAYERYNKSEMLFGSVKLCGSRVFFESSFTVSLFRFLQLLCEGHNAEFQNYLRTQMGNTTIVNVVVCSVDYFLRLQESIADFHWYYIGAVTIDLQGKESFLRAFKVAKQVIRTFTEYIQGPCTGNQECLALSRLWDCVAGLLRVFAVMQRQLYREPGQVELLRELLSLQEELFILLLSMLEGSVCASSIAKLMADMLVDSAHYFEDIMHFFSIFVKLKDVVTSKAFQEYDRNKDGLISYQEFELAMTTQQQYTKSEIEYLMECADTNRDGLLDYMEFTERFHQPAENIGFHMCVLIVQLSEHLPDDARLCELKHSPRVRDLLVHFRDKMGCIEILGKSGRVERVYFEVKKTYRKQWKTPQIEDSRQLFLHTVDMNSQKKKLQGFINFCEDTIFEVDCAEAISECEERERRQRAEEHIKAHHQYLRGLSSTGRVLSKKVGSSAAALGRGAGVAMEMVTGVCALLWLLGVVRLWHKGRSMASAACRAVWTARHSATARNTTALPHNRQRTTRKRSALRLEIPAHTAQEEPRTFSERPYRAVTLSYNRSKMKPPSQFSPPSSSPLLPPSPTSTSTEQHLYVPRIAHSVHSWTRWLARQHYALNFIKLCVTFIINVFLLMFRVQNFPNDQLERGWGEGGEGGGGEVESCSVGEVCGLELQDSEWMPLLLWAFSLLHFFLSSLLVFSYCYIKVPLIIFKKEKWIARQLEAKQLWLIQAPTTLAEKWDGIVVPSQSFPRNYWDKQVKRRVCKQWEGSCCNETVWGKLGIATGSPFSHSTKWDHIRHTLLSIVDVRYYVWACGVVLTNMPILYHIFYCFSSFVGLHWNSFFFSLHLLDLVLSFKLLKTVISSVLHNGKQLAMTVLMTCVVIYIYTVIAFNFFRSFYRQATPEGEVNNCNSMARCFIYHIDQGLRSGGGIADVLQPAVGKPDEFLRLCFDITFFFFVIVILLAIIQGLIIDAFGELRDKDESVAMEMQTKCFVCGLPRTDFDHIPHGFDTHISQEHNMANYLFFLMYLIKKRESEFSGQESYVWDLYLKQKWSFFPTGVCFQSKERKAIQAGTANPMPLP